MAPPETVEVSEHTGACPRKADRFARQGKRLFEARSLFDGF
jgi:hypothetical protein